MTRSKRNAAAALLVFSLIAVSAPTADAQWRASLRAGLTSSTLTGDSESDFTTVTRLSGGGNLSYLYPSGFVLEPGLHYTIKGANADGVIEGVPVEATFDLAYLEIPVFFGYVWQRSGRIHPKVFAGPVLAFNLDSTVTFRAKAGGPEFREADDSVEGRELDVAGGLGVEWDVGGERLTFGLQGTYGLSNARTAEPELRNVSVGLFAGIIF